MPHFTLPIDARKGPLLKLGLSVSQARRTALLESKIPVPTLVNATGLVDTGASGTCVDMSLIEQLGIPASGNIDIFTPSTGSKPVVANQFDISLIIFPGKIEEHSHSIPNLAVTGCELKRGYNVLLGRDVLSSCILVYNGRLGQYTLAF